MGKASGGPRARRDAPLLATGGGRGSALGRKYDLLGYQLPPKCQVSHARSAVGSRWWARRSGQSWRFTGYEPQIAGSIAKQAYHTPSRAHMARTDTLVLLSAGGISYLLTLK